MPPVERFDRSDTSAASAARACCEGSTAPYVELCVLIMSVVHDRADAGEDTTIFDLHNASGAELARIFTVMRALEHDQIVDIRDDASDAFGAKIVLRDDWQERVKQRNAA